MTLMKSLTKISFIKFTNYYIAKRRFIVKLILGRDWRLTGGFDRFTVIL